MDMVCFLSGEDNEEGDDADDRVERESGDNQSSAGEEDDEACHG
jgi:hypothetical protein